MKKILFYFILISNLSLAQDNKINVQNDSIVLLQTDENTIYIKQNDLNDIISKHPEFLDIGYSSPDILYNVNPIDFESEVGQDDYFLFYAYFLKEKHQTKKDNINRKKFIEIYNSLNRIFSLIDNGGTGFAHLYMRLYGYAEFSLLNYNHNVQFNEVSVNYSEQKKFFIESLKLIAFNRLENEWNYTKKEKQQIKNEIKQLITKINNQITDSYLLNETQKFLFSTYKTY